MNNKITKDRLYLIEKLKNTQKPYAKRIAEIMKIDEISDLQVELSMADCIIELEKLLKRANIRVDESKANNNYNTYKNIGF